VWALQHQRLLDELTERHGEGTTSPKAELALRETGTPSPLVALDYLSSSAERERRVVTADAVEVSLGRWSRLRIWTEGR
jgi:hypothetical protein